VCLAQNGRQQKRKQVRALAAEEAERAQSFTALARKCVAAESTEPLGGAPSRLRAEAERLIEEEPDEYCAYLVVSSEDGGESVFLCRSGCAFFDVTADSWSAHLFGYEAIGEEERAERCILSQSDLQRRAVDAAERAKRFTAFEGKCAAAEFTGGTPKVESRTDAERLVEREPGAYCGYLLDANQNVYLCKSGSDFFDAVGWSAHVSQHISAEECKTRGLT